MGIKDKVMEWLHLDDLIDNGKKYLDARIELVKLEVSELLTNLISALIVVFIILFFCLMMLAFLSIALGAFLNEKMNSQYAGYLIMGGIFLLLIVGLFIYLPQIKNKIRSYCGKLIYDFMDNNISKTTPPNDHDNK
jgi:hypothetical protein